MTTKLNVWPIGEKQFFNGPLVLVSTYLLIYLIEACGYARMSACEALWTTTRQRAQGQIMPARKTIAIQ